jgi:hypothetical protein
MRDAFAHDECQLCLAKTGLRQTFFQIVKGFAFFQNTLQKQGRVKCEERAQRVHTIQNHKS